jgi:hypothetical protein
MLDLYWIWSLESSQKRRDNRPKWVSTVIPGVSKAWPKTTFAVFRPTPGKVLSTRSELA